MYGSSILSIFTHNPSSMHFGAAKIVMRYIKGTNNYGIKFIKGVDTILFGYCDNTWVDIEMIIQTRLVIVLVLD